MSLLLTMNILIINNLIKISHPIVTKINEVTFLKSITAFYDTPSTSFNNKTNTMQNMTLTNTYTPNMEKQNKNLKHIIIVGFSLLGILDYHE